MKVLLIGDVVGKLGRRTLGQLLPDLRPRYSVDLIIANGENAAGGKGLTVATAEEMFQAGVDIITSGNHIWAHREIFPLLDGDDPVLRPLNYPPGTPGKGVYRHNGVGVINLIGRVFMPGDLDCPFRAADAALASLEGCPIVIVDMHGEATSEKTAIAWYLDGRVSAVVGTHTHVATADARILPKGTAYVTDLGMVGPSHSIIGMDVEAVLQRFLSQLPTRFTVVEKGCTIFNSVLIEIDEATGLALSIQRLDREVE
ncbi:MAG: TIGR00282 family metallophosphoesterase [Dehalococcoidia bacterium]